MGGPFHSITEQPGGAQGGLCVPFASRPHLLEYRQFQWCYGDNRWTQVSTQNNNIIPQ